MVRPMLVVAGLRRLGYKDAPSVGDHITCAKLLDHPDGPITIKTGVDAKHCGKKEVARIQRQTKLKGTMWTAMLDKKLDQADYDDHLRSIPMQDLVPTFWSGLASKNKP